MSRQPAFMIAEAKALDMFNKGECGFRDRAIDMCSAPTLRTEPSTARSCLVSAPSRQSLDKQPPFDGRQSRGRVLVDWYGI